MKKIVKVSKTDMVSSAKWDDLLKMLDVSASGLNYSQVEMTVETVFFLKST